ncbi:hypothetical protein NEAUS04_0892 [Nematocida ausubeli]|nr:hypothetical protein NEAUS05_1194 [Nematocida ausubeli]KAI5162139.1 hypothetical protein NEAUS04_0892 [Nematocida ausubeli]
MEDKKYDLGHIQQMWIENRGVYKCRVLLNLNTPDAKTCFVHTIAIYRSKCKLFIIE